jgi:hypothetical protein
MVASASHPAPSQPNMQGTTPGVTQRSPETGNNATSSTGRHNEEEPSEGFLGNAVKNIFGPCVGMVDVASLFIQGSCRGPTAGGAKRAAEGKPVLGMSMGKPAPSRRTRRQEGETLEFASDGHFDDDLSAISAHTLEEMERLQALSKNTRLPTLSAPTDRSTRKRESSKKTRKPKKPFPGQVLGFPASRQDLDWTYQVGRPNSNTCISLGVSTSGSASTTGLPEPPSPTGDGQGKDSPKFYTRIEV